MVHVYVLHTSLQRTTMADDEMAKADGNIITFTGLNAIEELNSFILKYEMETFSSFVKVKGTLNEVPVRSDLRNISRIFWEHTTSHFLPILFDGVPFIVLGHELRECCHGPDRHRSRRLKLKEKKAAKVDHDYTGHPYGRKLIQNTKTMNCPAAINVRSVLKFPSYKIENDSQWARRQQGKKLYAVLNGSKNIKYELQMYVAVPSLEGHKNHFTDEVDVTVHSVNKSVSNKIVHLVEEGVREVGEMRRHINAYSKANFPGAIESSNRFFPNNKCLRNKIYSVMTSSHLAASYLNDVILKEGLAAILEAITGGAYDEADAECRLVLESSITRATFYAMELSAEKKQDLSKKYLIK